MEPSRSRSSIAVSEENSKAPLGALEFFFTPSFPQASPRRSIAPARWPRPDSTHCRYPPLHCIARRCTALHATRCNDATTGGFRQERALCQIARFAIRLAKYSLSSRPYATRFCDWPPSTLPRAPSLGNEPANANPPPIRRGTLPSCQSRPPVLGPLHLPAIPP
jgi:hypothetical protein